MTLIVVSGAPGTGKSTIARELGAALRLPVLSLDPIKEALADILGLGDEDWSNPGRGRGGRSGVPVRTWIVLADPEGSEFCLLSPR